MFSAFLGFHHDDKLNICRPGLSQETEDAFRPAALQTPGRAGGSGCEGSRQPWPLLTACTTHYTLCCPSSNISPCYWHCGELRYSLMLSV